MSYATNADFYDMKQRFNVVVNFCLQLQKTLTSDITANKTKITSLQTVCDALNNSVNSVKNDLVELIENGLSSEGGVPTGYLESMGTEYKDGIRKINSNLNALNNQLDKTIEYLANWCDNGNVNMDDLRETVGEKLNFDEDVIPNIEDILYHL